MRNWEGSLRRKGMQAIGLATVATSVLLCGCLGTARSALDAPSASPATPAPATAAATAPASQAKPVSATATAPTIAEVQAAVARCGQNAFTLDGQRFLVGDFNGDGSLDLAVAVKPASGMLARVNSDYALWKLEDPHQVRVPDLSKSVHRLRSQSATIRANASDVMLMVIHGNRDRGWRDQSVQGIYLLKNVAAGHLQLQTLKESLTALRGKVNPAIFKGDVIKQTMAGDSGLLVWTGVAYAWLGMDQLTGIAPPVAAR